MLDTRQQLQIVSRMFETRKADIEPSTCKCWTWPQVAQGGPDCRRRRAEADPRLPKHQPRLAQPAAGPGLRPVSGNWIAQSSPARAPTAAFPDKQRITGITGGQTMASSKRKMKALVVAKLGDPTASLDVGVLKLEQQHPVPPLPPGSVRVRVVAAGLNFADMLQVQGTYQVSDSCLQATRLSLPVQA